MMTMRGSGRLAVMSSIIIPDEDVQAYVDGLVGLVGGPAVTVALVDDLPGDLGGRYFPSERLIEIDRPATVWVINHEVAHTVAVGHERDFVETLVGLALHFEASTR